LQAVKVNKKGPAGFTGCGNFSGQRTAVELLTKPPALPVAEYPMETQSHNTRLWPQFGAARKNCHARFTCPLEFNLMGRKRPLAWWNSCG
jgi:hypothetical protein